MSIPAVSEASVESRLSALDAAEVGSWFWDLSTNRITWDPVGRRLLGVSADQPDISFDDFFALIHPDDRFDTREAIKHAVNSMSGYDMIHRVVLRDGSIHWLRCKGHVNDLNNPTRLQGLSVDISWLRQAQESIRRNERMSAECKLALQLAHEINNPLEVLCNSLYLLQNKTQPASEKYALHAACVAYDRIAAITRQLLRLYSRPSSDVIVDLPGVLQDLLRHHRSAAEKRDITVRGECAPGIEFAGLEADVHQVLDVLLENAIEYSSPGGIVTCRIRARRDRTRAAQRGVSLVVADNGSGIPADIRPQLFQPFIARTQSRGLGLCTCSLIANRYGGAIRFRTSTDNGRNGSCFSVFLRSMEPTAARARSVAGGAFPIALGSATQAGTRLRLEAGKMQKLNLSICVHLR